MNIKLITYIFLFYKKEIDKLFLDKKIQNEIWERFQSIQMEDPDEVFENLDFSLCFNNFPLLSSDFKDSDIKIIDIEDVNNVRNWEKFLSSCISGNGYSCNKPLLSMEKLNYQSNLFDSYLCFCCGNDCPCLVFDIKPGSCLLSLYNK